jgi:hypothetical protein
MVRYVLQNLKKLFGWFFAIFPMVFFSGFFFLAPSIAGEIQLEWEFNSEPEATGYIVYWGGTSRIYPDSVDIGNQNTYTISGLDEGRRYYFSVTVYDDVGNESTYSNEVYTVVRSADSDKDGLSDTDEINFYATNPLSTDTDRDGAGDGLEVAHGSDPLDVLSIPYCAADFDQDGDVSSMDMNQILAEYGGMICSNTCDGDFDTDGDVDGKDVSLFIKFFGKSGCP